MRFTEDHLREWLERMAVPNTPDGDRARDVLAWIDETADAEEELSELGEKLGDFDEAAQTIKAFELLEETLDAHAVSKELGVTAQEQLTAMLDYAERLEAQSFALQELVARAGLIDDTDHKTDPLPLIAMFLPLVEEVPE